MRIFIIFINSHAKTLLFNFNAGAVKRISIMSCYIRVKDRWTISITDIKMGNNVEETHLPNVQWAGVTFFRQKNSIMTSGSIHNLKISET